MRARVNGVERDLPDGATVATVLAELNAPPSGVAVALDGAVVPRAAWPDTVLTEGAVVEVLTAVQGG
ncbi:sulfur carrier protein ThiS [Goodfellowiella coeruleoviolacea]|uniref:Sulfur carrier protein n=1 Tax=Goodfellowiella coeruleoviolacea TaxID=334858 RepID=A0AAE3GCB9_9PSEU|nr:sulfur carrier protein ThiS [Goodfellowiella coeruleoviolacea]MCP2164805.1 sulfur carrier protein [Goodfellowiella coeruleoviolacea]